MTLHCPDCQTRDVDLVGTNGAEYPEPLFERYECAHGHEFSQLLTARDGDL